MKGFRQSPRSDAGQGPPRVRSPGERVDGAARRRHHVWGPSLRVARLTPHWDERAATADIKLIASGDHK